MTKVHVFIFRRDLRVEDNLALFSLINRVSNQANNYVLPIFIFNDVQIDATKNKYFNKHSVEFMIQSLLSLNSSLNEMLSFFHTSNGDIEVLKDIKTRLEKSRPRCSLASVCFNIDYTPFAIKRDAQIQSWCNNSNIECHTAEDYTLLPINTLKTLSGTFFSVYTPFYKKFLMMHDQVPKSVHVNNSVVVGKIYTKLMGTKKVASLHDYYFNDVNINLYVKGGRENGLHVIKNIKNNAFVNYDKERDFPHLDKTTRLSAYLKFGCISIREAYHELKQTYGINHGLIREVVWREFYACITFNKPRVLAGQIGKKNLPFREKYDTFAWEFSQKEWTLFVEGKTGFPFIDAGIRMLYATGFCPNRLRMVLAMFAIKDLMTDPIIFERWFAKHLVDYDPSSNSGGVLWSSSTGCDSQPYFRIFSPMLQTQRYDPDAIFIKRWIPELRSVPIKDILNWDKIHLKYVNNVEYPAPMVNHSDRSKRAIQAFKNHA